MTAPPIERRSRPELALEAACRSLDGETDNSVQHTTVSLRIPGTTSSMTIDLERLFFRWLQDVMTEATGRHWRRRAAELDRIGTPWSTEAATACRNHARLMEGEFGDLGDRW